jgi:6-pyruvoyl-tetrahydropterin synthase
MVYKVEQYCSEKENEGTRRLMYKLRIEQDLNIGRELRLPYDIDNRTYGQHWNVIVTLHCQQLNDWGFVVDLSHIKDRLKLYDHCYFLHKRNSHSIDEPTQYPDGRTHTPFPPTMEHFAEFFFEDLSLYLKQSPHYKDLLTLKIRSIEIQADGGSVCYEP